MTQSWKGKEKCPRCGKTLEPSDEITPSTPITSEETGEHLCSQCALKAVADLLPDDSAPDIEGFLDETIKEISMKADVDQTLIAARCKSVLGSDIEISRSAQGYDITFYTPLMHNPEQTKKVIDYAVRWIAQNPLSVSPLSEKIRGETVLAQDNVVVFLFIPASRPFPSDEDLDFMATQILPDHPQGKVGWLVYSQPHDSGSENHEFIRDTLSRWQSRQSNSDAINALHKKAHTRSGRELVCLLAFRGDL